MRADRLTAALIVMLAASGVAAQTGAPQPSTAPAATDDQSKAEPRQPPPTAPSPSVAQQPPPAPAAEPPTDSKPAESKPAEEQKGAGAKPAESPEGAQPPPPQPPNSAAAPAPAPPPAVSAVLDKSLIVGVLGKDVRSSTNEDMGRVVDVIVDRSGQTRAAIIDFGGFLGVGSRRIAVDWNALHFAPEDKGNQITLDLTREQVKAAPEYKEGKQVVVLGPSGSTETIQSN